MTNKIILRLIGIFLLVLSFLCGVSALGVSPGRTTIEFSPNLERDVSFSILNGENINISLALSVEGDLENYITFSDKIINFSSGEDSKDFIYKLKLPENLSSGMHKSKIIISEISDALSGEGAVVRTKVSVVTQLYVFVPYPGKFIEADLNVVTTEDTNVINFYVPFVSKGDQNIEAVSAVIDIYKNADKIDSVDTNTLSIRAGERRELSAVWNPDVAPGEYSARMIVSYDGNNISFEKNFSVGGEDFGILGISVNDFTLGDVARLTIIVQNKLSDSVENVFVNLKVYDSDLEGIAELKSQNYNISALSNREMIVYWDTEFLEEGRYSSKLDINYDDKSISKDFKIDVSEDMMIFSGVGFVISSVERKVSTTLILWIVIGILVLLNLLWFLLFRKKLKR